MQTSGDRSGEHRWILHIDMDAFYASVEQRDHPVHRGRPVIVGADPQGGRGRGVVSAASYEARAFGIHSAMPISRAYRRCPEGVFLPVRMSRYQAVSSHIFRIFGRYTDLVEPLSLDEAFLDVTGSLRLFGSAEAIGRRIQMEILTETELGASVGIATNKFVAKVASDLRKPNGFVQVPPRQEAPFLQPLPIERLWGVGPKTAGRLRRMGLVIIGDVAARPQFELAAAFGQLGAHLWELAHGIDTREVIPEEPAQSVGAETTFPEDTADPVRIRQTVLALSEGVARRLRVDAIQAGALTLKLRDETFRTQTRSVSLSEPTDQSQDLYRTALMLLERLPSSGRKVRLLGVTASRLSDLMGSWQQLSLELNPVGAKQRRLTEAVDRIHARFGEGGDPSGQPTRLLVTADAYRDFGYDPVPSFFRESKIETPTICVDWPASADNQGINSDTASPRRLCSPTAGRSRIRWLAFASLRPTSGSSGLQLRRAQLDSASATHPRGDYQGAVTSVRWPLIS